MRQTSRAAMRTLVGIRFGEMPIGPAFALAGLGRFFLGNRHYSLPPGIGLSRKPFPSGINLVFTAFTGSLIAIDATFGTQSQAVGFAQQGLGITQNRAFANGLPQIHFTGPLSDQEGFPFRFIGINIPQNNDIHGEIPMDREFLQAATTFSPALGLQASAQQDPAFQIPNNQVSSHLGDLWPVCGQTQLQAPADGEFRATKLLPVEIQYHPEFILNLP